MEHSDQKCACGCGEFTRVTPVSNEKLGWVKGEPRRFIHGHHVRKSPERIFEPERRTETANGCWEWNGARHHGHEYGRVSVEGQPQPVHRVSFELTHGRKVAEGMVIHHICNNPPCFNPEHLREVTHRTNILQSVVDSGERTRDQILTSVHDLRARMAELRVDKERYVEDPDTGCWVWMGSISSRGYGREYVSSEKSMRYAHRLMYVEHYGPIPKGMVLDHAVCGNHICVNPNHLEAVTNRENVKRRWAKRREGRSGYRTES